MSDLLKQNAAKKALEFVQNDMLLGLGSGSTVGFFLEYLGEKIRNGGLNGIRGIATSVATAKKAENFGIELLQLGETDLQINLAIDGADQVDGKLNMIKGLGKALLREKMVEMESEELLIIVDGSKLVEKLGGKCPLPVEIVQFGYRSTLKWLNTFCTRAEWWHENGQPVITDNGNYLVKCWFENGIDDPENLAQILDKKLGVVAHGLFLEMANRVIVADQDGIRLLDKKI